LYFTQILLTQILTRLKRIEKCIITNKGSLDSTTAQCSVTDNVGGINVSLLPAKDQYAYALILLDAFFTKEELSQSLMKNSPNKAALDEKRLQHLIHLVPKSS